MHTLAQEAMGKQKPKTTANTQVQQTHGGTTTTATVTVIWSRASQDALPIPREFSTPVANFSGDDRHQSLQGDPNCSAFGSDVLCIFGELVGEAGSGAAAARAAAAAAAAADAGW